MDSRGEPLRPGPESPVARCLAQPEFHTDAVSIGESVHEKSVSGVGEDRWRRILHRFTHFMYEKEPSRYSSIAPRDANRGRTRIVFLNDNARVR